MDLRKDASEKQRYQPDKFQFVPQMDTLNTLTIVKQSIDFCFTGVL